MPPEEITIESDAPLKRKHSTPCKGEQKDGTHSAALENRQELKEKGSRHKHRHQRASENQRHLCQLQVLEQPLPR